MSCVCLSVCLSVCLRSSETELTTLISVDMQSIETPGHAFRFIMRFKVKDQGQTRRGSVFVDTSTIVWVF